MPPPERWQCFELGDLLKTPAVLAVVMRPLLQTLKERMTGAPTLFVFDEGHLYLLHDVLLRGIDDYTAACASSTARSFLPRSPLPTRRAVRWRRFSVTASMTRIYLANYHALEAETAAKIYQGWGLNATELRVIAQMTPKRDYYYQGRQGHRLFQLQLGPVGLAFAGASRKADLAQMEALYQGEWGAVCGGLAARAGAAPGRGLSQKRGTAMSASSPGATWPTRVTWVSIYRQPTLPGRRTDGISSLRSTARRRWGRFAGMRRGGHYVLEPRPHTIWEAACLTEVGGAGRPDHRLHTKGESMTRRARRLFLLVLFLGGCTMMLDESTRTRSAPGDCADVAGRDLYPRHARCRPMGALLLATIPQQYTFTAQVKSVIGLHVDVRRVAEGTQMTVTGTILPKQIALGILTEVDEFLVAYRKEAL